MKLFFSEALALILAERANALVLPHIPYVYSGATASAKGTIQLTVKESTNMLNGIAKSLLQSGFKKQIYISLHGPSHISIGPVVRDFFDETGTSILYIDGSSIAQKSGVFGGMTSMLYNFDCMLVASYRLRNRIDDILLTSDFEEPMTNSSLDFGHLKSMSFESGATGYYFKKLTDHRATTAIPDVETRDRMGDEGIKLLNKMADVINIEKIIKEMSVQAEYLEEVFNLYPNTPAAFNRKNK